MFKLLLSAILSAALAASTVAPTFAQTTAPAKSEKSAKATKSETKSDDAKSDTKAAKEPKKLTAQQQKMKDCGAKWQDEKKAKNVSGRAAYQKFLSTCLKSDSAT